MARCATCGNDYEGGFEIRYKGRSFDFDCFECAVHKLAPTCAHCGCRILGHGVQSDQQLYCCSHCARRAGIRGITTHVGQQDSGSAP